MIHFWTLTMPQIKNLIFDADDTLWDNNKFFVKTTDAFLDLCIEAGHPKETVIKEFSDFEIKVVNERGYGSHNFVFILEHLFSLFNNSKTVDQNEFDKILSKFKSHTENDPPVFPGVVDILKSLNQDYDLFVLTKGNIKEQQEKIDRSGLKHFFKEEFVVSEKNDETYLEILQKHNWKANDCCMIGNSPKSDINPALRNGLYAIYIPYKYTWVLDNEKLILNHPNLFEAKYINEIPKLLNKLIES